MTLILLVALGILLSIVWTTLCYGIGPTPTGIKVTQALFKLLPENLFGPIYELGAGWGTLAFSLADKYPAAQVIAVEISPLPYLWMALRQRLSPRPNLKLIWGDLFQTPLHNASLIVCYLYPGAMEPLEQKIQAECTSTWVASHTFAFPHLPLIAKTRCRDLYKTPIYLYHSKKSLTFL